MIHQQSDNTQFITTTFRPEMLATADRFIGVTYSHSVSRVAPIEASDAHHIIQQVENPAA